MKTTAELIDDYLTRYPPSSFLANEVMGAASPKLVPFDQSQPEPPAAPRRVQTGAAAMTDTLTRADLDAAYGELGTVIGCTANTVREAALEMSVGPDQSGNTDFASLSAEIDAVASLAASVGWQGGQGMEDVAIMDAASEVARYASIAPTRQFVGRDGQVREQLTIDPAKASTALLSSTPARRVMPEAQMSDHQASEVDRLLALSQGGTRKPVYGAAVAGPYDWDQDVALAARKVDRYLELAEDGSTREYTSNNGSVTVTEADTTEPGGETPDEEEILRYLNMWAEQMGQSPLSTDTGNRSYSPAAALDKSNWGQRTRGPWFSGYHQP